VRCAKAPRFEELIANYRRFLPPASDAQGIAPAGSTRIKAIRN